DYVNRVLEPILSAAPDARVVFVGFSQGATMAYRAAVLGVCRPHYLIAVGGDVPRDIGATPSERFPAILIAAGDSDAWYSAEKIAADEIFLSSRAARFEIFRYRGGHEWTDELRARLNQIVEGIIH